jgi:hypothetical protein
MKHTFTHMHFASTFSYDTHNPWMRNGGLHPQTLLVHALFGKLKISSEADSQREIVSERTLSFLLFLVSVYIWISSAKISSKWVPFR